MSGSHGSHDPAAVRAAVHEHIVRAIPDATVRVEGGCTWGDVDHATHAFGMATPSGIIGTTGVGGLTLPPQ